MKPKAYKIVRVPGQGKKPQARRRDTVPAATVFPRSVSGARRVLRQGLVWLEKREKGLDAGVKL